MSKGRQVFKPKARLIQILGEHLIKDATVGLLELVKNSYDADATQVEILMYGLNTPYAKIIISDNGHGMDLKTFINFWMNPASGHKQVQKNNKKRTKLNRLPLGEKGVGRFAAQQIGNIFQLTSKMLKEEFELNVEIDWTKFDSFKKDLADVEIEYEVRQPQTFSDTKSGTILKIEMLKSEWKKADIERVANSLKRMKSPFKGATDFDVSLKFENCPEEFYQYENIEITDILDKAHHKLTGIVSIDGIIDFDYEINIPGKNKQKYKDKFNLKSFSGVSKLKKPFDCGDFYLTLHHYDKTLAQQSGFSKKDIDELCGVSVYRDGIRILPYGEKGDDWLGLDNMRVQDTGAIGNDTIIGMIEINQTENLKLKDKTNREGLIENVAFHQFKELVLATVMLLRKERDKIKPVKAIKDTQKTNIVKTIDNVKTQLATVAKKVSQDKTDDAVEAVNIISNVNVNIDELKKQIDDTVEDYETIHKKLANLAGTGLAAERFTHEFAKIISGALSSLERLKKSVDISIPKIKKEINTIAGALEALRNDIRLLGPMFYIKKVGKEKPLDLKQILENTLSLQERFLKEESINIDFAGDSFIINMREGSCMQIFNNLIDNSIYWLTRTSELDKRNIKIIFDPINLTVYVTDSGPGVVKRFKDKIFDPFFSMKTEEGRGLGLFIAKEILDEKNWQILLVSQDEYMGLLSGASFKIIFDNKHE